MRQLRWRWGWTKRFPMTRGQRRRPVRGSQSLLPDPRKVGSRHISRRSDLTSTPRHLRGRPRPLTCTDASSEKERWRRWESGGDGELSPDAAAEGDNLAGACTHGHVPGKPGRDPQPDHGRASEGRFGPRPEQARWTCQFSAPPAGFSGHSCSGRRAGDGSLLTSRWRAEAEGTRQAPDRELRARRPDPDQTLGACDGDGPRDGWGATGGSQDGVSGAGPAGGRCPVRSVATARDARQATGRRIG
jgi:hypothetical protein